ncbi:hypothetical protein WHR41_07193 [Cladosporium halotolerans]|uniref:Rpr2-domain-containing protein n=1 Tax=Cladosporium halotolerans TaxID=1052096 RepID=A0AB34KKQ2_9PEZI
MAKDKAKKGVLNKHLHARIAYLHQAAKYLSTQALSESPVNDRSSAMQISSESDPGTSSCESELHGTLATNDISARANTRPAPGQPSTATFTPPHSGLPLQLSAHLRAVAQKAQIRLSHDIKHAICKACSSPLIDGETCSRTMENLSKGGRKPWANVLVVKCLACGACKRFPVGAKKQKRKSLRETGKVTVETTMGGERNQEFSKVTGSMVDVPIHEGRKV